jgi:hypothetical protein
MVTVGSLTLYSCSLLPSLQGGSGVECQVRYGTWGAALSMVDGSRNGSRSAGIALFSGGVACQEEDAKTPWVGADLRRKCCSFSPP